ncbi:hypothetical protein DPEC_G00024990, partial [Dallia pectoralis]
CHELRERQEDLSFKRPTHSFFNCVYTLTYKFIAERRGLSMQAVIGIFVILMGVSYATVTICDATQKSSQCLVALGGTLDIKLMNNTSGVELHFKKNLTNGPEPIFIMKNNNVSIKKLTEGRSEFFMNNGTFRLTNLEITDAGLYLLEVYFYLNGSQIGTRHVQLDIQDANNKEEP